MEKLGVRMVANHKHGESSKGIVVAFSFYFFYFFEGALDGGPVQLVRQGVADMVGVLFCDFDLFMMIFFGRSRCSICGRTMNCCGLISC